MAGAHLVHIVIQGSFLFNKIKSERTGLFLSGSMIDGHGTRNLEHFSKLQKVDV